VTERRTDTIRVGVAGTGFAARAHLDALARQPGAEVVAIAGSDPARTGDLADRHRIARVYRSFSELLDDDAIDAVHNCTINRLHHEINLEALERGLHVLSEKPLAVDRVESAQLAAAAARSGSVAAVCFNYRFYSMVAELRAMLATGEYGAAHFMHGAYLQDWLLLPTDWNWRLNPADGGLSRAVADIGTHWADLVQHVTGDAIVEVFADLATLHATRERPTNGSATFEAGAGDAGGVPVQIHSEDHGTVLVRFASGARGSFTISQTSAGRKNGLSFQIDATEAAFAWHQEEPNRAWVGRRGGPNLELLRDPASPATSAANLTRLPAGHPEGWLDALAALVANFHDAIRAADGEADMRPGAGRLATFADGHALVCLVDAIIASHKEQRWAPVARSSEVIA
jgi:predicted dehydrogenase